MNGTFCAYAELTTRYTPALEALEAFLFSIAQDDLRDTTTTSVAVHAGFDDHGLYVSEVDFLFGAPGQPGSGGQTYMNDVPGALGLLYACELFLRTHDLPPCRPEGWSSDLDVFRDSCELVKAWLVDETE